MKPEKKGRGEHPITWVEAQKRRDDEVNRQIKEGGKTGDRRIKKRPWQPQLWMFGSTTDDGSRPITDGRHYWESPDIYVESGDPWGRIIAGQPNFIWARIWNLGRASAAPTRVEYRWANPSLGLGPGHVFPFSPNDRSEFRLVPPLSYLWIRHDTPWIPPFVNDGHECLFVNCDNHIMDPLRHPWMPTLDRHAGQKNVTVKLAAAATMLSFHLEFNNIFPYRSEAHIQFQTQHLALSFTPRGVREFNEALGTLVAYGTAKPALRESELRKAAIRATRPLSVDGNNLAEQKAPLSPVVREIRDRGAAKVSTSIDERWATVDYPGADEYVGKLFAARKSGRGGTCDKMNLLHKLTMDPFQQRHLSLELGVPAGARPGDFIVYRFVQENEGFVVGGYTVVVAVIDQQANR